MLNFIGCSQAKSELPTVKFEGNEVTFEDVLNDVNILLRVTPKSKEVFVRWELPIRYFVAGLEAYPEKAKEFDALAQTISEISGLDIKRHDRIYWPQEGTMHHPDSPDNMFTNTHFFFYPDFEKLVDQSEYLKVSGYLGLSYEALEKRYLGFESEVGGGVALLNWSGSAFSKMYLNMFSPSRVDSSDLSTRRFIELWIIALVDSVGEDRLKLVLSSRRGFEYGMETISIFDKLFIKYAYSNKFALKHGFNNEKAAINIARLIFHEMKNS